MENENQNYLNFRFPFYILRNSLLSLVYPQMCHICENSVEVKSDGVACGNCWRETEIFNDQEILCGKCGAFLKNESPIAETYCRRCEADEYDAARAVGIYETALAACVLNLKNQPFIPKRLQNLLLARFQTSPFQDATKIIPVPLSRSRLRERGFNQAAIIARIISRETRLKIDEWSLARAAHTKKHRAGMDRKSRFESVENVFEVIRPRLIRGENILLIDDVFTSGATVSACAKILKQNGANKVYVLTVARAYQNFL